MPFFRVWAPLATHVSVKVGGDQVPMVRDPKVDGWWFSAGRHAVPWEDYSFTIDDANDLPDPRSGWQPHGVNGPSRIVDHGEFGWTDEGFQARPLSSALIYELHVGTFTPEGTFDAVIEHLDHLRRLGVTHLEIMPVAEFPGLFGWGYDGVNLFAPRHVYGGPQGLKRLVDACHARDLGVLLDVVYNHLGPMGNYLPKFGPYFSDRHHTPWGDALNFDGPYSDEVRRYFCDNALMWLRDYHLDGLRLDAVHAIVDTSATPFLEQLAIEVDVLKAHLGRHLVLIAESDLNDPRIVQPRESGGFGLDAQWSDDFHHALHSIITGETNGYYSDFGSIRDLATAFETAYVYTGRRSNFRMKSHGRPPVGLSGNQFLGYVQNHDQLGNRARGDRLSHLTTLDRSKIAAALVLTAPFVPMLFQGEEFGSSSPFQYFADFAENPELARAVVDGRRKEFGQFGWKPDDVPDPGSPETFERSKIAWSEKENEPHRALLDWHIQLIELRRKYAQLTDGRLYRVVTEFDEHEQWMTIERGLVSILVNFSDQPRAIPIRDGRPTGLLLSSVAEPIEMSDESIRLPANSLVILGPMLQTQVHSIFRNSVESATD